MTTIPAHIKAPAVPQVNLLPPEVGQRRKRGARRAWALAFLSVFVLAIAAAYFYANMLARQAQDAALEEESRTAILNAQLAEFSQVDAVKAVLANGDSARQYSAAVEVFWPLLLSGVEGALPDTAVIETFQLGLPSFNQSPAQSASPFANSPVGTLLFTATVPSAVDASAVEDALNTVPFFDRARVTAVRLDDESAGGGEGGAAEDGTLTWVIDGAVDLTYEGMMFRFQPLWFGVTEETSEGTEGEEASGAPDVPPLRDYYEEFYAALMANSGTPTGFPELPDATPPAFVPGLQGAVAPPSPEPSPTPEEASA